MPVPIAVAPRLISQISFACLLEPLLVFAEHDRERAELLPERHRHRILQLRSAHLQVVLEFFRFAFERCAQHGHRLDQLHDARVRRDFQGSRVDIVGALSEVHVLVRVEDAYSPRSCPRCSSARLAMTSFAFMFVEVPAPP